MRETNNNIFYEEQKFEYTKVFYLNLIAALFLIIYYYVSMHFFPMHLKSAATVSEAL